VTGRVLSSRARAQALETPTPLVPVSCVAAR